MSKKSKAKQNKSKGGKKVQTPKQNKPIVVVVKEKPAKKEKPVKQEAPKEEPPKQEVPIITTPPDPQQDPKGFVDFVVAEILAKHKAQA